MKNISSIIKDALSIIDTLNLIPLSVWLTINNRVVRVSMSSNYFRDCVKISLQPNILIFEVIFSTTDNKLIAN